MLRCSDCMRIVFTPASLTQVCACFRSVERTRRQLSRRAQRRSFETRLVDLQQHALLRTGFTVKVFRLHVQHVAHHITTGSATFWQIERVQRWASPVVFMFWVMRTSTLTRNMYHTLSCCGRTSFNVVDNAPGLRFTRFSHALTTRLATL